MKKSASQISRGVLVKIATSRVQTQKDDVWDNRLENLSAVGAMAMSTAPNLANMTQMLTLPPLESALMAGPQHESKELFDKLLPHAKPSPRPISLGHTPRGGMAGVLPDKSLIVALPTKTTPFVAAHELGHATGNIPWDSLKEKIRQFAGGRLIKDIPVTRGGLLGGALLTHAALTSDDEKPLPITAYMAPAAPAVAPLLTQAEELRATLRARKILRAAGMSTKGVAKNMLAQQLHYGVGGAMQVLPVAGGVGILAYLRHARRQEGRE